ncbi:MAG TPA: TRAP transporter small permease [Spirochaetia bacterium]|nr:TRAP transporter small permease [Spirochaetia bacterium]
MKRVSRFIYDLFEVYLGVAVIVLLISCVSLGVFFRYVLDQPNAQLFELSVYSFVWLIYLGGSLAVRYNQHIRFDLIYRQLSERARDIIDVFFDLVTTGVLLYILVPSIRYTIDMYPIKASALRVPWTFLLVVYPIFLCLVISHDVTSIVRAALRLSGKKVAEIEAPPWL